MGRFCFTKSWIRISTSGTKRTKVQLGGGSLLLDSMRTLSSMPSAQTIVRTLQRFYETMNMPPLAT